MDAFTSQETIQRYAERDLEYKDKAREVLTKSLGFEPPVLLSMNGEITIRRLLREIDNGADSHEGLQYQLEVHTELIKKWIPKYTPEYNHLLNK